METITSFDSLLGTMHVRDRRNASGKVFMIICGMVPQCAGTWKLVLHCHLLLLTFTN